MVLQGRAEIGEDAVLQDILRNTAEFASDPSLPYRGRFRRDSIPLDYSRPGPPCGP